MNKKKGFTLVELLVVIAIIGLLATVAVVALGSARAKARDAKRIADVRNIQSALEQYYSDLGGYPLETNTTLGASTDNSICSTSGISGACTGTTYMGLIPAYPIPAPTGANDCTTAGPDDRYCYTGTATSYNITFSLETPTAGFSDGGDADTILDCTASENGLICD